MDVIRCRLIGCIGHDGVRFIYDDDIKPVPEKVFRFVGSVVLFQISLDGCVRAGDASLVNGYRAPDTVTGQFTLRRKIAVQILDVIKAFIFQHLRPICNVLRIFQLVNFGSARGDAQDAFGLKRFHAPIRLAFFIAFGERVNKRVFSAANAGIDLNERIRRDIRRVTDAV